MARHDEVEIKFVVHDVTTLQQSLASNGFEEKTPPTHETNTLYDLPDQQLRNRGELLRLRLYGDKWKLTHKSKGTATRHKTRVEHETTIGDGEQMNNILIDLGYGPTFVYEKFRSEWSDGHGEVVIDRTPIGDIAEIEGPPDWIDQTAKNLGVMEKDYITKSYAELFFDWKRRTKSDAENMTYKECGTKRAQIMPRTE
ncbi:MAG TPA: class IV adenylate cyclase [candidate division Zixibacteria bacterium]|nr:class IV adenylate cyclase [candidate division Zixibacteria bacterium]